ncbi:MAG: pyrimidine-nucleoside phosphorylase [Firmicutes bacterium]|nr:pyrimidine-nucleoside phosphorylase [Bacillota bacterium]
MRVYDIITKTRDGLELSREEIRFLIDGYTKGQIPDYQMAAWCMAVYFQGLSPQATAELTMAMVDSGEVLTWPELGDQLVDKHSTGGVGDKTTLVLLPWVAAAGVRIAKMSGRGLGHTGGTLDKLSSIPGFRFDLTRAEFLQTVAKAGLAIVGQTGNLVPADKKLYALRDVTATVDSIPLIASSIMSKKIAAGASRIVLDVKTGSGAFMEELPKAKLLAETMVDIGAKTGRRTTALVTNMDQPLGVAVGNALEVREAIETLQGNGPEDLTELCLALGAEMLVQAEKVDTPQEGRRLLLEVMDKGLPLQKFRAMVEAQGGDARVIEEPELLPQAPVCSDVTAVGSGYVTRIHTKRIGLIAMELGAGRQRIEDDIDLSAGLEVFVKVGDEIQAGQLIAKVYGPTTEAVKKAAQKIEASVEIEEHPAKPLSLILARVSR